MNTAFRSSRVVTVLSVAAAILLAGSQIPVAGEAQSTASFTGRIFEPDSRTPVSDAVVKAFSRSGERIFRSSPTGPDGSYTINGLVPGEYDLGISVGRGIFLVEDGLTVSGGQNRAVSFALRPFEEQESETGEDPEAAVDPNDEDQEGAAPPEGEEARPAKRRLRGAKKHAGLITGVVLGGAAVVGVLVSGGSDDDGSPN